MVTQESPHKQKTQSSNFTCESHGHCVFFYCGGVAYIAFVDKDMRITADAYRKTLHNFIKAITDRWNGKLSDGILLLHDNVRHHASHIIQTMLQKFKWNVRPNSPYSLNLAPCDFYLDQWIPTSPVNIFEPMTKLNWPYCELIGKCWRRFLFCSVKNFTVLLLKGNLIFDTPF